jgi:hypothetical protein
MTPRSLQKIEIDNRMRLSKSLCAAVADTFVGSHPTIEALFVSAGVKSDPPQLPHGSKWKEWLFRSGQDPSVDSLSVLGNLLEEFMDRTPKNGTPEHTIWKEKRTRVEEALEADGLRYFRPGRILPQGEMPQPVSIATRPTGSSLPPKPDTVDGVLEVIVKNIRRAMYPLTNRRKGVQSLSFNNEYDVQDLLHALLRPWVSDIRPEEHTPSYAGTSTRMDFLLPAYSLVIETKIVRDRTHAKTLGQELIVDRDHYCRHPKCKTLWCVIYDPEHFIANGDGLKTDLEGPHSSGGHNVTVRVFILSA